MVEIFGKPHGETTHTPTKVKEPSRTSQLPKRFYKGVSVELREGMYCVLLDEKPVKTPSKALLASHSKPVATMIAREWEDQNQRIDPMTMPVTRLANTAIDGVVGDMQAVKEDIVRFASSDLLCYRADAPEALVELQNHAWDKWIDWAQSELGSRFVLAEGVMFVEQPAQTMGAFNAHVGQINEPLALASTHVITSLTGSAILAMAVFRDACSVDEAWTAAHVDEDWNISQWGEDQEAAKRRATRLIDMQAACACIKALR